MDKDYCPFRGGGCREDCRFRREADCLLATMAEGIALRATDSGPASPRPLRFGGPVADALANTAPDLSEPKPRRPRRKADGGTRPRRRKAVAAETEGVGDNA